MRLLEFLLRQAPMKFLSVLHIVSGLAMLSIVALLVVYARSNPKKVNESLINSLMGLAFIFFVFKHVMVVVSGTFDLRTSLPLSISDITFMTLLVWSLCKRETVSNLIYYYGMLFLVLYSIYQVNVYPYFNAVYILDMMMVALSIASFIIFVLIEGYNPKFKYFKNTVIIMVIVGLVQFGIDFYLNSHYLFLEWFSKATPFSLLKPHFIDGAVYSIIGVVLFIWGALMALYFRRKAKREAVFMVSDIYMTNLERRVR